MAATTADDRIFAPRPLIGWTLFTLTAGFVNGAAVMACNSFVTHVTGSVTNIGLDASLARTCLLVAFAFIAGGMVAVLLAETLKKSVALGFLVPIVLSFVLLVAIAVAGKHGVFGAFGAAPRNGPPFGMLGMLAAAMGMVNASIATATANKVRITHLTGPATDLAGNLVRAALDAGEGARSELRWAALRLTKIVAFGVGAAIAARVARSLEYDLFSAAALILILALGFAGAPTVATATPGADHEDAPHTGSGGEPPPANSIHINISRCEDAQPLLPPISGPRPDVCDPGSSRTDSARP